MSWIEDLLSDHHISYITEGHSHSTTGWINTHCPFCQGPKNYHLGISLEGGGCHCWRCGPHPLLDTLCTILHISPARAKALLVQYKGKTIPVRKDVEKDPVVASVLRMPKPNRPLTNKGREYLAKRGFDPNWLEKKWGLKQTGPVSLLDGVPYNHRILIPIFWNGRAVSFQSRDITGTSNRKYLACPKNREIIHHKTILYGDQAHWLETRTLIIVEGATDVWRLGPYAAATFGIEVKMEQVLQMIKHADRFVVTFDNEPLAQKQADKLAVLLRTMGKRTAVVPPPEGDPGDMSQEDADHFVREVVGDAR